MLVTLVFFPPPIPRHLHSRGGKRPCEMTTPTTMRTCAWTLKLQVDDSPENDVTLGIARFGKYGWLNPYYDLDPENPGTSVRQYCYVSPMNVDVSKVVICEYRRIGMDQVANEFYRDNERPLKTLEEALIYISGGAHIFPARAAARWTRLDVRAVLSWCRDVFSAYRPEYVTVPVHSAKNGLIRSASSSRYMSLESDASMDDLSDQEYGDAQQSSPIEIDSSD
jgi:hypothetical protein